MERQQQGDEIEQRRNVVVKLSAAIVGSTKQRADSLDRAVRNADQLIHDGCGRRRTTTRTL